MVGMLVLSIGLSLGGPTGYAINPARDFGPWLFAGLFLGDGDAFGSAYFISADPRSLDRWSAVVCAEKED